MIEQSKNEKKMLAIERAKFRLRQRLEAIEWEYEHLKPIMAEFKAKAQLPELPSEAIVEIVEEDDPGSGQSKAA